MHRAFIIKFILGAFSALALMFIIYQVPPVHNSLSWRMELVTTYLRGIIYPADRMPTPEVANDPVGTPYIQAWTPVVAAATAQPAATHTPQGPVETPSPTPTPTPLPETISLPAPKFEQQDINNCGPASLSLYLRYYGWDGDQNNIAEVVKPVREDRNVNIDELQYYARTQTGWLQTEYRVGGTLEQIKAFLAHGIPVLIEEAFHMDKPFWPSDDLWAGHYLLITGYDDSKEVFTAQDTYYGPDKRISYAELDNNWKAFNRVFLLIYPPEQAHTVQNLLGSDWDVDANRQSALLAAQAETEADPEDAFAWFNLGTNLVYFERYGEAVQAYGNARQIGLPQRMLRYQFGPFIAYFRTGRNSELLALAEYALQRTPNSEEALLWMGWGLFRDGEPKKARDHFQKALEANSTYQDAQYALNFINNQ